MQVAEVWPTSVIYCGEIYKKECDSEPNFSVVQSR